MMPALRRKRPIIISRGSKRLWKSAKANSYFNHLLIDEIKLYKPHRNDNIKKKVLIVQEIKLLASMLFQTIQLTLTISPFRKSI